MVETPGLQKPKRVCLLPRLQGVGGMVSFQYKLAAGLEKRGVQVCYDLSDQPYQAVLVIGGTRQLGGLWRARRNGVRVVQRLNGMNWLHRVRRGGSRMNTRHYLRAEYGNWMLSTIRSRLAEQIVYQSQFSQSWWERVHGPTRQPHTVIYNGVNLEQYNPAGPHDRPADCYRLLMVEGSLMGGYESGLQTGIQLAESLENLNLDHRVELMVVGRVLENLKQAWDQKARVRLTWAGEVPREKIPGIDRSAHLLFSADLNAACPNSVIEALACGLPVASFDTGALAELVSAEAGCIVPYGGDPWKLDPPDVAALAQGAALALADQASRRVGARRRAEQCFGLDQMVEAYQQVLFAA